MVSRSNWKRYERTIAKLLGGSGRMPLSGANETMNSCEDFRPDCPVIGDAKKHKTLPIKKIEKWLKKVEDKHTDSHKPKILVLATPNTRDLDSLVVIRLSKFIEILKKAKIITEKVDMSFLTDEIIQENINDKI